ncbi:hypothetical protein GTY75_14735 [Streptomyces sp. SID8381]|uniref:hypothetical protein n=1 Tax=unclassified Streptomyces TaxID=2593676 RepID=UPI00037EE750|nr:hypothetical protein [Streptomyces sp. Amel2xE9]MYX27888.1 hypothetical protein [Streptomyces sp. SID8381]MYX41820.1 hypothetical protein [Streptomyces sp. SID89]
MSSPLIRRTCLVASAAALALLATACGGSSDDDGKKGGDATTAQADKSASAAPAAAQPLSAAELEKAALTQADVKSGKVTAKLPATDDIAQDKVKTDKPACTPLALLQVGSYAGKPAASVKRSWMEDAKKPEAGASAEDAMVAGLDRAKVVVTLASYADGGAEQAMKDLTKSAADCAGGFSFTVAGDTTKAVKVATGSAPQGADEALAVTYTMEADGDQFPVKGVVVRKGATLAYFPAVNLAAAATGKDFAFPTQLVDAQLAKLK